MEFLIAHRKAADRFSWLLPIDLDCIDACSGGTLPAPSKYRLDLGRRTTQIDLHATIWNVAHPPLEPVPESRDEPQLFLRSPACYQARRRL